MGAITRDRRQHIITELLDKKHVTVRDLAVDLDLSEATIRRDLKALAAEGELMLVHGGATLPRVGDFSFRSKQTRNVDAKRQIGKLAVHFIREGDQIFLDSGTTAFEMCAFLRQKRGLSVVANSARLALELDTASAEVILLGGNYRPDRMDTVGPITTNTLEQMRGFIAFIGADGLSRDFGPSAADVESAHLHRLVVQNARETVLLADHTKFESASLFRIVQWDQISRLVTDVRPSDDWMAFFDRLGIDVIDPTSESSTENP